MVPVGLDHLQCLHNLLLWSGNSLHCSTWPQSVSFSSWIFATVYWPVQRYDFWQSPCSVLATLTYVLMHATNWRKTTKQHTQFILCTIMTIACWREGVGRSLMTQWLTKGLRDMKCCHDPKVMGSNLSWVELRLWNEILIHVLCFIWKLLLLSVSIRNTNKICSC